MSIGGKVVVIEAPTLGDAELVDGLRRGESGATRALYARFAALINRLVWRTLGADQDHDDVVQQVFVNVLAGVTRLRDPALLQGWVSAVTVNTVRRELRGRGYRRIFHLVPEAPERRFEHVDADQQLMLRRFYAVLDTMSADERLILVLHWMEGYTLPEVATLGGYSLATAKRRLARARATLERVAREDSVLASFIGEDHAPIRA